MVRPPFRQPWRWLAGTRPKVQPPASPVSGIAQGGVARSGVALDARQTVIHPDKRQSHFPIGLGLGMELLGRVHESDRDVELVWQAFIGVPNRGATFRTEGAHDAPGFRECFWFWAEPMDLIWTIANPDRQWAADRSSAVIVVVETNPKGIATEFSCDGSAKAMPSINPGRFSDRRSGFVVHGNLPASVVA